MPNRKKIRLALKAQALVDALRSESVDLKQLLVMRPLTRARG